MLVSPVGRRKLDGPRWFQTKATIAPIAIAAAITTFPVRPFMRRFYPARTSNLTKNEIRYLSEVWSVERCRSVIGSQTRRRLPGRLRFCWHDGNRKRLHVLCLYYLRVLRELPRRPGQTGQDQRKLGSSDPSNRWATAYRLVLRCVHGHVTAKLLDIVELGVVIENMKSAKQAQLKSRSLAR